MTTIERKRISFVCVPGGTRLITCRSIREELDGSTSIFGSRLLRRADLCHYGKCQRISILYYSGYDYTQVGTRMTEKENKRQDRQRIIFTDLKHAALIDMVDLNHFNLQPGSYLRIIPKGNIRFEKVTVKICDLFNHELTHEHAIDETGRQEWVFTYLPVRYKKLNPGNVLITIQASQKPRPKHEPLVDLYELSPDELREHVFKQQQQYRQSLYSQAIRD